MFEHVTPDCQCEGKKCTKCKHVKCVGAFYREKRYKSGLASACKKCTNDIQNARRQRPEVKEQRRIESKEYRTKHAEQVKERKRIAWHRDAEQIKPKRRAFYRRNRKRIRADQRGYYQKASAQVKAHAKHYYWQNQAYCQSRMRGYYRLHPDKFAVHSRNRQMRKKAVSGTYTAAQVREMLKRHRYRCYYCGNKLKRDVRKTYGYDFEIEHTFPISRVVGTDIPANDISYLVPSCKSCNQRKKDKFPWEYHEGGRLL